MARPLRIEYPEAMPQYKKDIGSMSKKIKEEIERIKELNRDAIARKNSRKDAIKRRTIILPPVNISL